MTTITLTIESSYQTVYEQTAEKVAHALESVETPMPYQMRKDLMKQAHDVAFEFVDSVINVGKYTHNAELIKKIQDTHMDGAIAMYNRIFDEFYNYSKNWKEM
jgi:hypothetical protein